MEPASTRMMPGRANVASRCWCRIELTINFAVSAVAGCCCRRTMTAGNRTFLVLVLSVVVVLGRDTLSQSAATDKSERRHTPGPGAAASPSSQPASSSSRPASFSSETKTSEKTLDSTTIKAVEKALLNALGLKSKPKPSKNMHIAPYMLDIYNRHLRGHQRRPNRGQRPIPAGNTIRSFVPRGT